MKCSVTVEKGNVLRVDDATLGRSYTSCISPMEHNNDGERVYIAISAEN